jgi:hypothetical protein
MPQPPTFWPEWSQIISLPVALLAIVVAVSLYRRQKQSTLQSTLKCQFDAIVLPVEVKAEGGIKSDIEILYKKKPAPNLYIIQAKLWNASAHDIRGIPKDKGEKPVTFVFGPGSQLLDKRIVEKRDRENARENASLNAELSDSNKVSLDFGLLKPSEEITVLFVCTGESEVPGVDAHMPDFEVSDLTEARHSGALKMIDRGLSIALLLFGVGIISLIWRLPTLWISIDADRIGITAPGWFILGLFTILLLWGVVLRTDDPPLIRKIRKRWQDRLRRLRDNFPPASK